ncbi:phosphate butyryltransferase [Virgibacillus pantothenticus]|uniref:phosphate butyryltransferase n=1 Tax=Virgibacillus pantothenticus TaxID=1473 RepID=UPI00098634DB|nr:phosphate butyryltransferase [Virgibacillus pantothenticus]
MGSLTELKFAAKKEHKKVVSVANAEDENILQVVKIALEEDLCQFLLVGDELKIMKLAKQIGLNLYNWREKVTIKHETDITNIAQSAVHAVKQEQADIVMKGKIPTKKVLQAVLHREKGLRTGKVLSHVAVFEVPSQEKLVLITDAAMNIAPDIQQKAIIVENAVKVAQNIGISLPKVAALAPVEVINPAMQSTVDAAALTQMQRRGQIENCLIDGPLAFDNAVSKDAAAQKGISSEVAGDADILLVPSIEVGNALYKSFVYYAQAKVAAIISGAKAPIVLTSRADPIESKLHSLSLAIMTATTK